MNRIIKDLYYWILKYHHSIDNLVLYGMEYGLPTDRIVPITTGIGRNVKDYIDGLK